MFALILNFDALELLARVARKFARIVPAPDVAPREEVRQPAPGRPESPAATCATPRPEIKPSGYG